LSGCRSCDRRRSRQVVRSPRRTCVGCRTRREKRALLRLVADERGHLRLDARKRRPGRGAYVCPTAGCIEAACQRSAWGRGLRRRVAQVDPLALHRSIVDSVRRALAELTRAALSDGRAVQVSASGLPSNGSSPGLTLEWGQGRVLVTDPRLGTELESLVEQLRQLEVRIR